MNDPNASGIAPVARTEGPPPVMASGFWATADMPPEPSPSEADDEPLRARLRGRLQRGALPPLARLRWRLLFPLVAVGFGLAGFLGGVGVTERPEVADAGVLTKLYYTLGLFIFGGMDLGTPVGGPVAARTLLWVAYFLAPAITASAVIEAALRLVATENRFLRRLNGHVVVAGSGRLTALYLMKLRRADPTVEVVVVVPASAPDPKVLAAELGARVITGDIRTSALLEKLHVERARRVMLLTDDDFTNLDTATKILARAPETASSTVVHVADLRFLRALEGTRLQERCQIFNGHQIAAKHLVLTHVLEHFNRTEPTDLVVLAGFGRFGETVLSELQMGARGAFSEVVIIDVEADRRALVFDEQIGFAEDYVRTIIAGDLRDPALWMSLSDRIAAVGSEPVFVLASGVDRTNLRTAMWLQRKYPKALVIARSESSWTFAKEVCGEAGIEAFSVAELVAESMPDAWFKGG